MAVINENNDWVYDNDTIQDMAVNFFLKTLYREDNPLTPLDCSNVFPPLDNVQHCSVARNVEDSKIKRALFGMGAFKAPGPN